jgi:hypothetical protein
MRRASDGGEVNQVPEDQVETFRKLGFEIVPDNAPETDGPAPVETPEPEPFDFGALSLQELKAAYGRAMSEGVALPEPHGNAKERWYAKTLTDSGWEPTDETTESP